MPILQSSASVQDVAWTLLEYLPLGGTTALLLRKAGAGAGVLELELQWPWAAVEPTPDALPVHLESLILALQVRCLFRNGRSYLSCLLFLRLALC